MSLFASLKAVFASKTAQPLSPELDRTLQGELQLRLGAFVKFDLPQLKIYPEFVFDLDLSQPQPVEAYGEVDLGMGVRQRRYYLDNDCFIQVIQDGERIADIKLYAFGDTEHLSQEAFDRQLTAGGKLGGLQLSYADQRFQRVWGENDASWSPAVPLTEDVTKRNGDGLLYYRVQHYCMLYERTVVEGRLFEYLLLSAEADEDNSHLLVNNVGIDLSSVDLTVS